MVALSARDSRLHGVTHPVRPTSAHQHNPADPAAKSWCKGEQGKVERQVSKLVQSIEASISRYIGMSRCAGTLCARTAYQAGRA